jgi:hypothetical protein
MDFSLFDNTNDIILNFDWIYYLYTWVLKKPPRSLRGFINSHVNLKKEKNIHRWILWRSEGLGLIQRIHKFRIKIRKSKESIFNTNTINRYINSELKIRKIVAN